MEQYYYDLFTKLLIELANLNQIISHKIRFTELIKGSGTFLFGFNPAAKVNREEYRRYIAFTNAITAVLYEFGICVKSNGYCYIVDAVMLIIDQNRLDIRLIDDVYPYIKQKYELNNIASIEHCIRNAIISAYKKSKKENIPNRMYSLPNKPTNKQFLLMVTQEVSSRMCEELMPANS